MFLNISLSFDLVLVLFRHAPDISSFTSEVPTEHNLIMLIHVTETEVCLILNKV